MSVGIKNSLEGDLQTGASKKRVVVGMSGGVDSAVCAALLQEAGYEVIGLTLTLWKDENEEEKAWQDRSCCKVGLARYVAKKLNIPHHTLDVQQDFQKAVIDDFCETYLLGQTPNPCVRCNAIIKFETLRCEAKRLGADFLATGHYCRVQQNKAGGHFSLLKGCDIEKDQSYFLYRLTQDQLAATLFPLGGLKKEAVYEKAAALGLPYEEILESQEVCFVTQKDYREFLTEHKPESLAPGNIVDTEGNVLGQHKGVAHYTLGQRRGLGIAQNERAYVTALDPERRLVVLGKRAALSERTLRARDLIWGGSGPPSQSIEVSARLRHRGVLAQAELFPLENGAVELVFEEAQTGVKPGQSVVFYRGDEVLGGGIISAKENVLEMLSSQVI